MGSCATSRKIIHIIEKKNDIQIFVIRKIKDLIRNNPFMNISVDNFFYFKSKKKSFII
jgi:hypothetical protein